MLRLMAQADLPDRTHTGNATGGVDLDGLLG